MCPLTLSTEYFISMSACKTVLSVQWFCARMWKLPQWPSLHPERLVKKPPSCPEVPLSAHLRCISECKCSSLRLMVHILDGRDDILSEKKLSSIWWKDFEHSSNLLYLALTVNGRYSADLKQKSSKRYRFKLREAGS